MPKDEFDPQDPLELNGVELLTHEDTTDSMCECFIEEFMRMGCGPDQVLALFRIPHYLGMNMVLQKRGEQFIRGRITEIYSRWGRPVSWPSPGPHAADPRHAIQAATDAEPGAPDGTLTDPMGGAVPRIKL